MLNGVGGRTIEEAKARLSYREALSWMAYRAKRGNLHPGRRVDRAAAMLAQMYWGAHSEKPVSLYDFMPWEDPPPITLETAMKEWC